MKNAVLSILVAVAFLGLTHGKILPDYIKQCKRKDPDFAKCALDMVESLRDRLKKGIPKIQVPALEPLSIPNLSIVRDQANLQIKANLTDIRVFGASNFKVESLKVDLDKYTADLEVYMPALYAKCNYDVKGSRILVLPLEGDGDLTLNITGARIHGRGSAKVVDKKGVKYLHLDKIHIKTKVKDIVVNFHDPSRPEQSEVTTVFFNNNGPAILDIVSPIVDETSAYVASAFINRVLGIVPLHELVVDE